MSENDPWKRLVALVAHLTPNTEDGARRSMAVLDAMEAQFAARAAEATQHQQEIAALTDDRDMHAEAHERIRLENIATRARLAAVEAERDELWGSNHLNANALRLCQAERDNQYTQAVEATQRALLAEQALANVEAERDRMKAALEFYANPFGRLDSNGERVTVPDFYAEMEFGGIARAALTPQGQSTDGETR